MVHCTACEEGHVRSFNHSMADQFKFGSCGVPKSFFKLNWAFGHKWPGENAHAGVRGKCLTCQKVGRVCSCVRYLKFQVKEADVAQITTEKQILPLASIRRSSKLKFWGSLTIILKVLFVSCMKKYKYWVCVILLCSIEALISVISIHFWYFMNSGVYEA